MVKKKHGNKGDGWVTFVKSRGLWKAGITVNGITIERTARTRAEAIKRRDTVARGRVAGLFGELSPSSKWDDLIRAYLVEKEHDGKRSTHDARESILRLYVAPHLGQIRIDKLTSGHGSAMIRELRKSGGKDGAKLSEQTCKHALKQARAVEHFAFVRDLISKQVLTADFIKSPKVEKTMRAMNPDEWQDLIKSIENEPLRALVHLGVASGLRRAELLGLTWDDLKFKDQTATVRVERTISRQTSRGLVIGTPKNKSSRRTINIAGDVVDELVAHKKRQDSIKSVIVADGMKWSATYPKMRWVFTNGIGNPIEGDYFGKQLHRMTSEAGIDSYTPHELRHTCASFAIASEVQLKELSEFLGHSSVTETGDTYGHLYPASRVETAVKIASFVDRKK